MAEAHLVAYEYGSGTVWGYVVAKSAEDIVAELPEVEVHESAPNWMTDEDLEVIRRHATVDLLPGCLDDIFDAKKRQSFAQAL